MYMLLNSLTEDDFHQRKAIEQILGKDYISDKM